MHEIGNEIAYIVKIYLGRESISESRVRDDDDDDDDDDDTRLVTDFRTDFRPKLERVRKAYIFLTRRSFPLIAIQVRRGLPHSTEEQTGWVLGSSGLAATFSLIDLFIMDNERIEQQS